jgi:hypothetical protein
MDIGQIGGVNEPSPSQPRKENQRRSGAEETREADKVNISPEAREAAEVARLVSLTNDILEIRDDKVAQATERIEAQEPDDEQVNRTVAQRLLEDLL